MSSVNVDYDGLINLKRTLENSAINFDEIRNNIGKNINAIIDTDWEDNRSEEFRNAFFGKSDKDITKLVNTMTEFSAYLQTKIDILEQYFQTNIHF